LIKKMYPVILLFLFTILISCQEGLKPEAYQEVPKTSTLTGTVEFLGGKDKFPDSTRCWGIYVAAFKQFPKDSSGIFQEILKGNVYVKFESLPFPTDTADFTLEIKDAPVNLEYIAISMQTDSARVDAQRVIGVYTLTGDNTKPSPILIEKGKQYHIKIMVDWDNLPPQPF